MAREGRCGSRELGEWGEIGIEVGFRFGLTKATPDNYFQVQPRNTNGPRRRRIDED
jgi:hypothetical protein